MYRSMLTSVYKLCSNQLGKSTSTLLSGDQLLSSTKLLSSNTFARTLYETTLKNDMDDEVSKWMRYNDKIYPPQAPGEERRPAVSTVLHNSYPFSYLHVTHFCICFQYVCHEIKNLKYSEKKMWYVAMLIRGMTVDEARRQLKQVHRKGATAVTRALNEAVEMAIKDHGVEFRTNLWVGEYDTGLL